MNERTQGIVDSVIVPRFIREVTVVVPDHPRHPNSHDVCHYTVTQLVETPAVNEQFKTK